MTTRDESRGWIVRPKMKFEDLTPARTRRFACDDTNPKRQRGRRLQKTMIPEDCEALALADASG
jgi:hypothetical protein